MISLSSSRRRFGGRVRRLIIVLLSALSVVGILVAPTILTSTSASAATLTGLDTPGINPDSYSCSQPGYIDFENLADGYVLSPNTINGIHFTTTNGYTWLVGDFSTGLYNGKYPNGPYTSQGNHWAWLGQNEGAGRVDFNNGPASYFSLLTSANTPVQLDAYDTSNSLLGTAGPVQPNINTGKMDQLSVSSTASNIAYVIVHDSGNFFLVDGMCTNAPGVQGGAKATRNGVGTAGGHAARYSDCSTTKYPVNCASGDFWHTFTDVSVPGRGPSLDLTRTYNSLDASTKGLFGYGWISSYESNLVVNGDGSVTITEDDGSQVIAEPDGGGGYTVPSWADSTLNRNGDGTWTFERQQLDTFRFNSSGQVTSITDRNQYQTSLNYASGQLSSVTDPESRSIQFQFGSNGLVSQITDPANQVTHYYYNSPGQPNELTGVTDPMSRTTSFGYDSSGNHQLDTMTFPSGQPGGPNAGAHVTNVYDSTGRVLTQTDPASLRTTFAYTGDNFSVSGGTTTITDPHGDVETQNYVNGLMTSETKGVNSSNPSAWTFTHDPTTLGTSSTIDPNQHTTTSVYDQFGNVLSTTDALGHTTTYTYNSRNEVITKADPNGITSVYSHDSLGNVVSVSQTSWQISPNPTRQFEEGVSCPSVTLCVQVGNGQISTTPNPSGGVAAWTTTPIDGSNTIWAISCPAITLCVAGDSAGNILTSNNPTGGASAWNIFNIGHAVSFRELYCPTTSLCVLGDNSGDIVTATNPTGGPSAWVSAAVSTSFFASVTCASASLCVLVDGNSKVWTSTNPTGGASSWTGAVVDGAPSGGFINDVSCPSAGLCIGVDGNGNVITSTNPTGGSSAWQVVGPLDGTPLGGTGYLITLSCPSTSDCVAADQNGDVVTSTNPLGGLSAWTNQIIGGEGSDGFPWEFESCPSTSLCVLGDGVNDWGTGNPLTALTTTASYQYGDSHFGDVTKVFVPDGHVTDYTYDSYGDVASTTAHPSSTTTNTTTDVYDVLGRKVCEVSPNETAAGVSCPPAGQPRIANTSTWVYNQDGQATSATDALGHTTTNSYDGDGNQTLMSDPIGNQTKTTYDADDRTVSVTKGFGSSVAATNSSSYDVHPGTSPCSNSVTGATYCTTTTDPGGAVTVDYFDAQNRKIEETQPAAGTTINTYDSAGNLHTNQKPGGLATYGYDNANRLTSVTYSSPASGYSAAPNVTYSYNADDQRIQMTDGTGTSTYGYDTLGRLNSTTNGANSTVRYGYDFAANVTSITYPGSQTVTRTYDGAGELASVKDWLGHTTTYSYDHDGNPTGEVLPTSPTPVAVTSGFNVGDQTTSIGDSVGATSLASMSYGRNADGQASSETDTSLPSPSTQSYSYDQISRVGSDSSGSFAYNTDSSLTGLPAGTTQAYSPSSELQSSVSSIAMVGTPTSANMSNGGTSITLSLPSGIQSSDQIIVAVGSNKVANTPSGYNAVSVPGSLQVFDRTATGGESSVTITYNSSSTDTAAVAIVYRGVNPTTPIDVSSTATKNNGTSITLPSITTTKSGDRLMAISEGAGSSSGYTFTPPSGMTNRASTGATGAQTELADQALGAPGATGSKISTYSNRANLAGALIALQPATTTYGYNTSGDRTSTTGSGTTTMGYDQAGRMVSYGSTSYAYNGDGLRMSKTLSGQSPEQFTFDLSGAVPQVLLDGSMAYVYGLGTAPIEQVPMNPPSSPSYYLTDQLGSVRGLVNQSGQLIASYTFSSYGHTVGTTGTPTVLANNPFGFAGSYTDSESAYLFLMNRYYDPTTAQFMSVDPAVDLTQTPYSYANGEPVDNVDPSGEGGTPSQGLLDYNRAHAQFNAYCVSTHNMGTLTLDGSRCGEQWFQSGSFTAAVDVVSIVGCGVATVATVGGAAAVCIGGAIADAGAHGISDVLNHCSAGKIISDSVTGGIGIAGSGFAALTGDVLRGTPLWQQLIYQSTTNAPTAVGQAASTVCC
jgi:RHS repeat-associated protein